ncbi:hypothetical protein B0H99_101170 [Planomicrobium soli]|uniref:Uncharacterized protein n=1 Tax=Planomicrobium soli TaxID=1176648 RepID=A0A2P8H6X2_9BACL|nr:hypothetical protein [Planomicrobium soli]PSL41924.1 hypothetical protein B0H99_101170 [Planomicrobium soli]
MEPRKKSKNRGHISGTAQGGLSYGVLHVHNRKLDRKPSKILDFLTQTFLFLLGGAILCGMLYALISYT